MRSVHIIKNYGIPYLYSWAHRITGVGLILYLWLHIYTLSFLPDPAQFDLKLELFNVLGLNYLEWLLALPVIFHSLNGGRLILYETFGSRRDEALIAWVTGLTIVYTIGLGLLTLAADLSPASSISMVVLMISLGVAVAVVAGVRQSKIGIFWKIQRTSGAFMLLLIPIHMLLMHLGPTVGHDPAIITARIRGDILIRVVDVCILISALYHGAYGLISIVKDYLTSKVWTQGLSAMIVVVSVLFAWVGIKTMIIL